MNRFNPLFGLKRGSRGQSLVEMTMMLPLLMIVLMGIVEYSHMYMTALRVSNLSREVTNSAFRNCGLLNETAMAGCLNLNTSRVTEEGQVLFSDFEALGTVIATAYEWDTDSSPPIYVVGQDTVGEGGFSSRYPVDAIDPDVVSTHERIVVGEVFYPYETLTPLGNLLRTLNIQTVIYEVTIY